MLLIKECSAEVLNTTCTSYDGPRFCQAVDRHGIFWVQGEYRWMSWRPGCFHCGSPPVPPQKGALIEPDLDLVREHLLHVLVNKRG